MTEEQVPPNVVKVEATEGCNLRCHFCGVASIRGPGVRGDRSGPYKFMDVKTATAVAKQMAEARWNSRIEFAMHGEPTLNPDLHLLVGAFRQWLPKANIMLTTNGIPLLDGWRSNVTRLYKAGLNTIALDDYPPHPVHEVAHRDTPTWVQTVDYPQNPAGNPHRRRKPSEPPLLSVMVSIAIAEEGTHATLNNGAGMSFAPTQQVVRKRCVRPFREFTVRWDGAVALCCNDWRGEYKIGNVLRTSVAELWQHEAFRAARRKLYAADRDFGICAGCDDFGGYRPGLLPDHVGKETLPRANADDDAAIDQAMAGPSFTEPVARKWEQEIVLSRKPR